MKNPQKTLATKKFVSFDSDTFVDMRCYLIESYIPRLTALRMVPLAIVTMTDTLKEDFESSVIKINIYDVPLKWPTTILRLHSSFQQISCVCESGGEKP